LRRPLLWGGRGVIFVKLTGCAGHAEFDARNEGPKRSADVVSHPSKNEGLGTRHPALGAEKTREFGKGDVWSVLGNN
jgi:hypothetical protein